MFYDVQEILNQSFLTLLDSNLIDLNIEPNQKIDCRPNLRKKSIDLSRRLSLFICGLLFHRFGNVFTYAKYEGLGGETIEFFFPLLTPYSDMMNPFLRSIEFGSPSSLSRAENPPDNGVFSISLTWIPYSNLYEITYLTDSYHFEFNLKLFNLSCPTYLFHASTPYCLFAISHPLSVCSFSLLFQEKSIFLLLVIIHLVPIIHSHLFAFDTSSLQRSLINWPTVKPASSGTLHHHHNIISPYHHSRKILFLSLLAPSSSCSSIRQEVFFSPIQTSLW